MSIIEQQPGIDSSRVVFILCSFRCSLKIHRPVFDYLLCCLFCAFRATRSRPLSAYSTSAFGIAFLLSFSFFFGIHSPPAFVENKLSLQRFSTNDAQGPSLASFLSWLFRAANETLDPSPVSLYLRRRYFSLMMRTLPFSVLRYLRLRNLYFS